MQSYKPEVKVDGLWSSNALRFATKEEAERSAANLFSRWTLTTAHRAAESDDPVAHALNAEGKLQFLPEQDEQVSTYIVPHDVPEGTVIVAEEDKEQNA